MDHGSSENEGLTSSVDVIRSMGVDVEHPEKEETYIYIPVHHLSIAAWRFHLIILDNRATQLEPARKKPLTLACRGQDLLLAGPS